MIRLSEAMAKLYCCEEVTENHVKEAYRLLSHSIIRIEQPDVNLEEEEDEVRTEAGQAEARQEAPPSDERQGDGAPPTKKLKISYEEYKSIGNLMIMYMRKEEARMEESGNETGLRKSDVINWYLGEIETEIESTEELGDKKLLLEKIMDRLMYHDQVIIPLSGTGLRSKSRDEETQETEDPIVVVHPDYVLEI